VDGCMHLRHPYRLGLDVYFQANEQAAGATGTAPSLKSCCVTPNRRLFDYVYTTLYVSAHRLEMDSANDAAIRIRDSAVKKYESPSIGECPTQRRSRGLKISALIGCECSGS
jgi:hypothetical protein